MSGCLNCGKELKNLPKKRVKVFCDTTCRSNYWQKVKRLEAAGKSADEIIEIMRKLATNNKPENKKRIENERQTPHSPNQEQNRKQPLTPAEMEGSPEIKAAKGRIAVIQDELKHPPKTPLIGLRKWILVREQELKQLQEKINQ